MGSICKRETLSTHNYPTLYLLKHIKCECSCHLCQLWGCRGLCPSCSLEDPQMWTPGHSPRLTASVAECPAPPVWDPPPPPAFRSLMRISVAASPLTWTVLICTQLWMTWWVRASLTPGLSTDLQPSLTSSTHWTPAPLATRLAAMPQTSTYLSFSAI